MGTVDHIGDRIDDAARMAEHRDALWQLGLRAAILREQAARLCRRARWEARRTHHLLRLRVVRDLVTTSTRPRSKSRRRRCRAWLVAVAPRSTAAKT